MNMSIIGWSDPKVECCSRMINYECIKIFLTWACDVSKEVDSHDDDDFQFWSHVNIHGQPYHCSGGRQDSEDYLN